MHIYVYDDFVNQKKYNKLIAKIETRLTDLGLNGKIIRLNQTQNSSLLIENELRLGAKTIVAVGNDRTFSKVFQPFANFSARNPSNACLGFIPIGQENNQTAKCLGISPEELACDVLSARRIETLDLGQALSLNNNSVKFFLTQAELNSQGAIVELPNKIKIEVSDPGHIYVLNISGFTNLPQNKQVNPFDGRLELYIEANINKGLMKKQTSQSLFTVKTTTLMSPNSKVILDNAEELITPAEISVLKNRINVIIGKDRNF